MKQHFVIHFFELLPALSTNGSLAFLSRHEAYQERVVTSYDRVTHLEVETFVYICHIFRQYCLHICIGSSKQMPRSRLEGTQLEIDCKRGIQDWTTCSQECLRWWAAGLVPKKIVGQKLKQESCHTIRPLKSSHRMMIWERNAVALDRPTCDNRDKLSSRLTDVWLTMGWRNKAIRT